MHSPIVELGMNTRMQTDNFGWEVVMAAVGAAKDPFCPATLCYRLFVRLDAQS